MDTRWCFVAVYVLVCLIGSASAGVCYVAQTCSKTCYQRKRSTTKCLDGWKWFTCSSYRTISFGCDYTCPKRVCCDGWGGTDCLTPLCQGLTECYNGGSCVGPNNCLCLPGFEKPLCGDIDECETNTDDCEHICANTIGSYMCSCRDGYLPENNSRTCTDIDECATANGGCDQHCTNLPGTFECSCDSGFYLDTDGKTCIEVDECSEGISGCAQGCANTMGSFTCSCRDGFVLDSDGKTCNDIDYCEGVNCKNGGTCSDGLTNFTCMCTAGITGELCELDVVECDVFNGGCQDICTNTFGSYSCSCRENKTLAADGLSCLGTSSQDSVFRRYNISGRYLPKGCWLLPVNLDIDGTSLHMSLVSTSEWYSLDSDENVHYTQGIVYSVDDQLAVPISLAGLEVYQTPKFRTQVGVSNDLRGRGSISRTYKRENCLSVDFSSSDINEFIEAGSFLKSMFASVQTSLPSWVRFDSFGANLIHIQDVKTEMLYGNALSSDSWCKGAPVFPSHLYSVFKFGTNFSMEVYGRKIVAPDILSGDKFCLIIDMCKTCGATVLLTIPKESRKMFSQMGMFVSHLIDLSISGFGISLGDGIGVKSQRAALEFWNGDHVFRYQIKPSANVWLGTELDLHVEVGTDIPNDNASLVKDEPSLLWHQAYSIDAFLTIPNLIDIFSGAYFDEWHGLVTVRSLSTRLEFKFLGAHVRISLDDFVNVNAYVSYGGFQKRTVCGERANPAGIYGAVNLRINPFLNVPLLQDWIFDAQLKMYVLVPTKQTSNLDRDHSLDTTNFVSAFQGSLSHYKMVLNELLDDIREYSSEAVNELITHAELSISTIVDKIEEYLSDLPSDILSENVNIISEIWQHVSRLQTAIDTVLDSIKGYIDTASDTIATSLRIETSKLMNNFNSILIQVNNHISSQLNENDGFGAKFEASVSVFELNLGWLNVELLIDFPESFKCSRFNKISQFYEGQEKSKLLIQWGGEERFGYFLKVYSGFGGAIAALKEEKKFTVQFNVFISILGVGGTQDIFINEGGIFLYFELNVWNIFLAQVDIFAEVGNDWYDLTLQVQGRFVATSREKRQVQTRSDTFDSSLLVALIRAVNQISEETKARLDGAKNALTFAQSKFSEAQQWLEGKKADVRNANQYFDDAVDALKEVQRKLDRAKEPYDEAIGKLNEAQKDIDELCQVKHCNDICFPGIKCKICEFDLWIFKILYPCCGTEGCMFRFPDPVCIAANSLCYAAKGAAYVALEAENVVVRAGLVPYEAAKLVVSAAEVVVDKSRAVLTLAEGALSLAQVGFEGAKGALEAAKSAIDVIKDVVGFAAQIMELVVQLGAENILDVRDCGFNIELSTQDLPVFDVSCKIKAFNLGWKMIRIRINFKNVFQSIWQAAKATINAIIDGFGGIVRKRRNIAFHSAVSIHKLLRNVRSSESILNDTANATQDIIDTLKFTDGFKADVLSDYQNRVDLFEAKCGTIANVISFLNETFQTLFYVANETQHGIEESLLTLPDLRKFNRSDIANNLTIENAGISIEHAKNDYNISDTDLKQILNETKYQLFDDPLLNEIDEMVEIARNSIDSELSAAESVQILNQWLFAMENTTNAYFPDAECLRFRDCVYHSMSLLYELYTEEDSIQEIDNIRTTINALENVILEVLQNASSSIAEALNASSEIMSDIRYLAESNQFCSKPPVFIATMENVTTTLGSSVVIVCSVIAEPEPVFWWFRNGSLVEEQRMATFTIHNVSHGDVATYSCTAGNIVANLSSDEIQLRVVADHNPTAEETVLETGYIILIAVLPACCVLLIIVLIFFTRYMRRRVIKTGMFNIELQHSAYENCFYVVETAENESQVAATDEDELKAFGTAENKHRAFGNAEYEHLVFPTANDKRKTFGTAEYECLTVGTVKNEGHAVGNADDERQTFGTTEKKHQAVRTAENERQAVGTAEKEHQAVSTAEDERQTFGTSENERQAVGTAEKEHRAISTSENEGQAVGTAEEEHQAVGTAEDERQTFGTAEKEHQAVGTAEDERQTFGTAENERQAFGTAEKERQAFGTAEDERQIFGTTEKKHQAVSTAENERQAVGTAEKEHQAISTSENEGQAVGTAEEEHQAVGTAEDERQTFGTAEKEHQAVGTAEDERQTFGTAENERQAFGTAEKERQAFGTAEDERQIFGADENERQAFGTAEKEHRAVGTAEDERQTFKTAENECQAFGTAENERQAFGTAEDERQTFGADENARQAFGTAVKERQTIGTAENERQTFGTAENERQPDNTEEPVIH